MKNKSFCFYVVNISCILVLFFSMFFGYYNIKTTPKFKEYFKLKGDVRSLVKTLNIDAGVKDDPNEKEEIIELQPIGASDEE